MARSIKEIQQVQLDKIAQENQFNALEILTSNEQSTLANLTSKSKVAIWRLWLYITAFSIYIFEQLFDEYEAQLEQRIAQTRVHTKLFYQDKALAFQFGHQTNNNGEYDNSNLTLEEIEASQVFKYASVNRLISGGIVILRIKVAGLSNNELIESTAEHLNAGQSYMDNQADAGTIVSLTSGPGDDLKLELDIYFDPQLLSADGKRLDGSSDTPVINAIEEFLKNIVFNGKYVKTYNADALQSVKGVKIPIIKKAWSKYAAHSYNTANVSNAGIIEEIRVADSGYFKLDINNTIINYIAYND